MVERTAQAEIRGIDIDKVVKGFADEQFVMKNFVTLAKTNAREIRWYTKTAGVLTGPVTTGVTATSIANTSARSLAVVAEPTYTRHDSHVRKYFVESPWISEEDIQDSDPDVWLTVARDITRAVGYQVDTRISNVLYDNVSGAPFDGTSVGSANAAGTGWDDLTNGDIVGDLTSAKKEIRANNYDPQGALLLLNQHEEKMIVDWVINEKGANITEYADARMKDGTVMSLLGLNVKVNTFFPTDNALIVVPKRACTYKQFKTIQSEVLRDPLIGRKIRVAEWGEAYLTDPKAAYGITDTIT